MKRFLKAALCFVLILCTLIYITTPAYAGTYSSKSIKANKNVNTSGSGKNTPVNRFLNHFNNTSGYQSYPYLKYEVKSFKEPTTVTWWMEAVDYYGGTWPSYVPAFDDYEVKNCIKYAVLTYTNYCELTGTKKLSSFYTWETFCTQQAYNTIWYENVNRVTPANVKKNAKKYFNEKYGSSWIGSSLVQDLTPAIISDADLIDEIIANGFSWDSSAEWYWNATTEEALDAVYIQKNNYWESEDSSSNEHKIVIVKVQNDDDVEFDYTSQTAEWLWNNAPTSGTYYGKSTASETNSHSKNIKVMTYRLTRTHYEKINWEYDGNGNKTGKFEILESSYSYSKSYNNQFQKQISYTVNSVENPQVWYKPYNLNTSSSCEDSFVRNYYTNYSATEALSITSEDGNVDGTGIEILDTNVPNDLIIEFGNTTWGLPNSFNLNRYQPYTSYKNANNTYKVEVLDVLGKSSVYTGTFNNGSSILNVSGYKSNPFRWNPSVSAAICAANGRNNTISLQIDSGDECIGTNLLPFSWESPVSFTLRVRTILDNTYYLCTRTQGIKFWELSYTQGLFQTYGVEYRGTYNTSGISNASIISSDFYCRITTKNFVQPLLYGQFEAVSVGGSVG